MTNRSAGRHWKTKYGESLKWRKLVHEQCTILKITNLKLNSAVLTLTRYSSNAPDPDGLTSGFKVVVDGLVHAGVIIDDNYKVIGMPCYKWEYRPRKLGGMVSVKIEVEA